MNKNLNELLKKIDNSMVEVKIDFSNDNWYSGIKPGAGWYVIKTNTPIDILEKVGVPKENSKAHINIPNTLKEIKKVIPKELVITQVNDKPYVVYNGLAKNIKARAREHFNGHVKTYCLCLKQYQTIWEYDWYFYLL